MAQKRQKEKAAPKKWAKMKTISLEMKTRWIKIKIISSKMKITLQKNIKNSLKKMETISPKMKKNN